MAGASQVSCSTAALRTPPTFMTVVGLLLLLVKHSHCYHAKAITDHGDKDGGTPVLEMAAPTCKSYECPAYVTVHQDKEFQIRRYSNHTLWMSTSDTHVNNSFGQATLAGFLRLFDYVKGNNGKHEKIPMTAPVVTEVFLSSRGPSCDTSFVVRLSVAKSFEEMVEKDDLNKQSLHAESWNGWCAAVRKFGGFTTDENIVEEAQLLKRSLLTTPWAGSANNTHGNSCVSKEEGPSIFHVAQYNSPFEIQTRVNEIWFLWDISMDSTNCK